MAGGDGFGFDAIGEPHIDGGADERGGAGGSADEQRESRFDGCGEAEVVAAVREEIEAEVAGHGGPVEEVRFVECTHLAAGEFRVGGELMQEPRAEWRGPRDEGGLEGVGEGGAGDELGDGEIAVASRFGVEFVEPLRRHDHDLGIVVGLREVEERQIAIGAKAGVLLRAAGGDARDEPVAGKGVAEAPKDIGIEGVVEVEDIAGIGVEDRDELDAIMGGGVHHPLQAAHEAVPVRASAGEREQRGGAQPRLARMGDHFLLGGPGPDGVGPGGAGFEIRGIGDEVGPGHGGVSG